MKIRVILFVLVLCISASLSSSFVAYANEQTVLPSWIYDFTDSAVLDDMYNGGFNVDCNITQGSHSTLTVFGGDPQIPLLIPNIYVGHALYLCIEYRTDTCERGELYVNRNDGVSMGESPDATVKWNWINDGEWHRLIVYCENWADAADASITALRFDPVKLGLESCNGESLDIRFLAFFRDEQAAKDFNLAAYQKHTLENGPLIPDAVRPPSSLWPEPEYTEMSTHPDDNTPGTLNITYSEDGKYATISYGTGDSAVSYTVPNNEINLFGGYAGTDDLGRLLFDASQVGIVTEDHEVGILYYLWHGEHGDPEMPDVHNIGQILENAGNPTDPALWGDAGEWHWWDEPLYGYYFMDDNWVMRKHVELLLNAGIDFLCLDTTALSDYTSNALKLMAILHDFNRMGYDAPKVVFYVHEDAEAHVQTIYESIYKFGFYKDTWYMQDGKPVIIASYDANVNDFFTVKLSQEPTQAPKDNAWPWMDFSWPQHVYPNANGTAGAISVSPAQPGSTATFADALLYGNTTVLGRSFAADLNSPAARDAYYQSLKNSPALYLQGLNFQAQWDRAIEADVPFVLVTGWNQWITQRTESADKIGFRGGVTAEFSTDTEMMKGGYFDNYYMQLAYNIQRLKGAAPVIVQDARNAVNLTGSFDVWDKVQVTYTDPIKDMLDRDAYGFGGIKYVNQTGKNDIVASKVTADTKNVYFYVQTRERISLPKDDTTWMQLFLDADSNAQTGWYGYDYIVNYNAKDKSTTTLARYCGTDGAYAFEEIGEINYRVKENQMMIAVPMELLGITNPNAIKFEFKWADSRSEITTIEQFYTDGDVAPLGRLNYIFQNCTDPETAEQYVPSDQIPAPEKTGCKSVIGGMVVIACLAALPCAFAKKKEQ